jgi:peptide-methionine (R)-S-oxide reductase
MNMTKRTLLRSCIAVLATGGIAVSKSFARAIEKVELTKAEWKERLTAEEFYVLRKDGTERPRSSPLNDEKREGQFHCAGCDLSLFESETKYESGTGWPSFYDYIPGHLETKLDLRLGLPRKEYHCARCGGHQGHVFKDGPPPTGLRYCNNGVALTFVPSGEI